MDFKNRQEYNSLLRFFEDISAIPRVSGNTCPIADYLVGFAQERGLEYKRDSADNVVIKKKACEGYESHPTVILQGHTDMVEAAAADVQFPNDGIKLVYDGDYLRADGTTLGADDGVALAYMLTVLDDSGLKHPEIEAIFTSNEEIGLLGAAAFDASDIRGKKMINIDSDVEGEFIAGCAGGVRLDIELPIMREACNGSSYKLDISGLRGGHSGTEINSGRVNAIKLAGEIIKLSGGIISSLNAGLADNAIAASAECVFTSSKKYAEINDILTKITEKYKEESELSLILTEGNDALPISAELSEKILLLIDSIPSGVVKMSSTLIGAVETSANQGIAVTGEKSFSLAVSLRSSKNNEKAALKDGIRTLCDSLGASCSERGDYPGWDFKDNSPLRDTMSDVFNEMYGNTPRVINIHAGLECGIFADKIKGLDCISMGPDNFDIHTPKERLFIPSFVRVFLYLKEVLSRL